MLFAAAAVGASGGLEAQDLTIPDSLPPGVTAEMVAMGQDVFEGHGLCVNCHGMGATGLLGPDLTDGDWWHARGTYLEIIRQILVGVPAEQSESGTAMPPKGGANLSDAEVLAAAAYVWTVSHPEAGDSLPLGVTLEMVTRGRNVFQGPGKCAECHGPDARGNVGPDLTDASWLHAKGSYLAILQRIVTGIPAERTRIGIGMRPRGGAELEADEVHAVAAYVWALSHQPR